MALRNLVRERLPHHSTRLVSLPRMNGTLVFRAPTRALHEPRSQGSTQLGITYLGLQRGQPRFRLALNTGTSLLERVVTVQQSWTLAEAPDLASAGLDLAFDVLDAQDDSVTLRVLTPPSPS